MTKKEICCLLISPCWFRLENKFKSFLIIIVSLTTIAYQLSCAHFWKGRDLEFKIHC